MEEAEDAEATVSVWGIETTVSRRNVKQVHPNY
ncbi:hypothetical protein ACUXCC_004600 [Cytobacillus horneckiae]